MKTLEITALVAVAFAGVIALQAGCSSDDDKKTNTGAGTSGYTDHSSPYPDCDAIIKACHPYDIGEGEIHDCHDQGHEATSNAQCAGAIKDKCLTACTAAAIAADGGTDAGGDAAPQ